MTDPDHIPLDVFHELRLRRRDAIREHGPLADCDRTLGALERELYELKEAMQSREPERIRAELLDLVTVALRRVIEMDAERAGHE